LTGNPRIGSPTARSAVANSSTLRLEVDFGDAPVIAGEQPVEDFGQPETRLAVDPAHDAEIDRGEAAVGEGEQIALVEVGVEEAVDQRLPQESPHQDRGETLQIVPGLDQRVTVGELYAVDPFEGHHPA
jgi:hypothetical protein